MVGIDDKTLESTEDFFATLEVREPGERVTLAIVHDGEVVSAPLKLGEEA